MLFIELPPSLSLPETWPICGYVIPQIVAWYFLLLRIDCDCGEQKCTHLCYIRTDLSMLWCWKNKFENVYKKLKIKTLNNTFQTWWILIASWWHKALIPIVTNSFQDCVCFPRYLYDLVMKRCINNSKLNFKTWKSARLQFINHMEITTSTNLHGKTLPSWT